MNCRSQFLSDDPSAEDFFGSRKPIADALVDIITQTPGGKTIGLAGPWGSGKSSLIRLVESKLAAASAGGRDFEVFTFDAWAHEGDPLRRVFLERLERRLTNLGWVVDAKISDALECRTTLAVKEEGVRLSRAGGYFAVALVVSAAYLGFLGVAGSLLNDAFVLYSAIAAASLVPVVLLLAYLQDGEKPREGATEDYAQEEPRKAGKDLFGLLLNKPTTVATTETRTTPDPTSVDFEQLFHDLLTKALADESRSLVLVVDNLDRIEPDDALSVWSTMRTFFESEERSDGRGYLRRLWLVVPFARRSMNNLLGGSRTSAPAALEKVFDFVLEVPPPISSGWRKYFLDQLSKALPEHAESPDLHTIFRLYQLFQEEDQWASTPRAAKRFANKLVATHHIWVHRIPLVLQALYVLLDGKPVDFADPEALSQAVRYLVGDDWQAQLAALTYGLEPAEALQVVVEPRIAEALERGDAVALQELNVLPDFPGLLEQVLVEASISWMKARPLTLFIAASAIEETGVEGDEGVSAAIWRRLTRVAAEVRDWNGVTPEAIHGAAIVIRRAEEPADLAATIGQSLCEANLDQVGVDKWYQSLRQLLQELAGTKSAADMIRAGLVVPGDGSQYLAILALAVADDDEGVLPFLSPKAAQQDVLAATMEGIAQPAISESTVHAVAGLVALKPEWEFASILESVTTRLRSTEAPLEEATAVACVALLRALHQVLPAEVDQVVATAVRDGTISQRWWDAYSKGEYTSSAALLSLELDELAAGLTLNEIPQSGDTVGVLGRLLSGQEEQLEAALLEQATQGSPWLVAFLQGEDEQWLPFARRLIGNSLSNGIEILESLGRSKVLTHYDRIAVAVRDPAVVANFVSEDEGIRDILEQGFSKNRTRLYRDLLVAELGGTDLEDFVVDGLRSYSAEDWQAALTENTFSACILEILAERERAVLGSPLAQAVVRIAALGSSEPNDALVRLLPQAARTLETPARLWLRDQLAERMCTLSPQDVRQMRADCGDEIAASDVFTSRATRFLDRVALPLVQSGATPDVAWVRRILTGYPAIVAQASQRACRDVKRKARARSGLRRTSNSTKVELESVIRLLL